MAWVVDNRICLAYQLWKPPEPDSSVLAWISDGTCDAVACCLGQGASFRCTETTTLVLRSIEGRKPLHPHAVVEKQSAVGLTNQRDFRGASSLGDGTHPHGKGDSVKGKGERIGHHRTTVFPTGNCARHPLTPRPDQTRLSFYDSDTEASVRDQR